MRYTEQSTHVEGTRGQPEDRGVHVERVEVEAYHADAEGVPLSGEDQAKLCLVIEGEALVPEKVQGMRKCWVVLQKYKKYRVS